MFFANSGITFAELKSVYALQDFINNGYNLYELKTSGGFTIDELKNYFTLSMLKTQFTSTQLLPYFSSFELNYNYYS